MLAIDRVDSPLGAVLNGELLQHDVFAGNQLQKRWAQGSLPCGKHPLFRWDALALRLAKGGRSLLLQLFPVPPALSVAKKGTLAGDGDILAVFCVDQRLVVVAFNALPPGKNRRQVVFHTVAEGNDTALCRLQRQVTFQRQRAAFPLAARYNHLAASRAAVDGLLDHMHIVRLVFTVNRFLTHRILLYVHHSIIVRAIAQSGSTTILIKVVITTEPAARSSS